MVTLQHYLIVFDRAEQRLIEAIPFGEDSEAAVAEYDKKEDEFSQTPKIEIVLISSDSLETIKRTHSNYFGQSDRARSEYFAGI